MSHAVVKYLHGSESDNREKAVQQKADELLPVVQELADPTIEHFTEVWSVSLINNQSETGVIIALLDSKEEARKEAEICFSALHEIHMSFPWRIRITKMTLQT